MITVRICVSSEKIPDFISWLIMFFLNWDGSHILAEYLGSAYHAVGKGVCRENYYEFLKTHHITREVEVKLNCTADEFYEWFKSYEGTPYSDSQYAGYFSKFLKWFVRNEREKAVCHEFIAWMIVDLSDLDLKIKDLEFSNPKEMFEAIEAAVKALEGK